MSNLQRPVRIEENIAENQGFLHRQTLLRPLPLPSGLVQDQGGNLPGTTIIFDGWSILVRHTFCDVNNVGPAVVYFAVHPSLAF